MSNDSGTPEVMLGGRLLEDRAPGAILKSIEITQELNHHYWCTVEIRSTSDHRFPFEDLLGEVMAVLYMGGDQSNELMFQGFVVQAELEYEITGAFIARLTGVTETYLMDLTPRQEHYGIVGPPEVVEKMAQRADIDFDADQLAAVSKGISRAYTQWGETDFQFLKRIADDFQCWVEPLPLEVDKNRAGVLVRNLFRDPVPLTWRGEAGGGLLHFRLSGRLGQPSMDGAHYDQLRMKSQVFHEVADEKILEAMHLGSASMLVQAVRKQSADKLKPGYVHQRCRVPRLEDYEGVLRKERNRALVGRVFGHGISRTRAVRPGREIKIEGTLDAQGRYGVTKTIHRWTQNDYENEFWCTPFLIFMNPDPPRLKPWHGVVPARVVGHPVPADKPGEVLIRFFWHDNETTVLARVMTPHAGEHRGIYFLPEVGDEVVVAFEDGDPERPLILGAVWNGVNEAPTQDFWGGESRNNDVKRIVTKSGHRIQLVDKKGKETISIATPRHTKFLMTENSNESGGAMVSLHSDGDIFINAGGRIHFRSKFFSREVG